MKDRIVICSALPSSDYPSSNRKTYIEFLRVLACFLVIVNHTNSSIFLSRSPSLTWFISLTWFFICKIAVPIFLLITGALLLKKQDTPRKSISRFVRIFIVLFTGSVIYYVYYGRTAPENISATDFLRRFFAGSSATNSYWYLYMYLALLCILPLLQKLAVALTKNQMRLLLFLSLGILGIIPLLSALTSFQLTFLSKYSIFFSPYIGMVFAGYYIERYVKLTRQHCYLASLVFAGLIVFQVTATYKLYQINPDSYLALDDRTMSTITIGAVCVYIMAKYIFTAARIPVWIDRLIFYLGSLSFGIYLVSDLMIKVLHPVYTILSQYFQVFIAMILWEISIYLAGALIAAALRSVPFLRKWL